MKIAVYISPNKGKHWQAHGLYLRKLLQCIVQQQPQHSFLFIAPEKSNWSVLGETNASHIISKPIGKSYLTKAFWLNVSLPSLLKRHSVDIFWDLSYSCIPSTPIPSIVLIHDFMLRKTTSHFSRSELKSLKTFEKLLKKKQLFIIAESAIAMENAIQQQHINPEKIKALPLGADETLQALSLEEKNLIKNEFSNDVEYFIYAGSIHPASNLVGLLKAFSIFKKRQQSSMKLIIAGDQSDYAIELQEKLSTYKYRPDVLLMHPANQIDLFKLLGAAYAFVLPTAIDGLSVSVLDVMRCAVPVISCNTKAVEHIEAQTILYANAENHDEIAKQMMILYKNEQLRNKQIEAGKIFAATKSMFHAAADTWLFIEQAATNQKA